MNYLPVKNICNRERDRRASSPPTSDDSGYKSACFSLLHPPPSSQQPCVPYPRATKGWGSHAFVISTFRI